MFAVIMEDQQPRSPSTPLSNPTTTDAKTLQTSLRKRTIDEIYMPVAMPEQNPSAQQTPTKPVRSSGIVMETPKGKVNQMSVPASKTSKKSPHAPIIPPENQDVDDPQEELEDFDWNDLETRFIAAMNKCQEDEEKLHEEAQELFQLFSLWMSVTPAHDENRAMKRLKTRIAYVQDSEMKLEQKKQHHKQVIQAFENALALLGQT